ncbi:hypothetical protein KIS1582_4186 [Cytobacillus firmus]|uniref:Uncharacterized protein n=1 Tax=Cytobacillus firmus TaxID=1399 RepID=A0A800N8P2_CYTFI|nr:hypothetical protein KIS1582_4186 [Cytobacillus firmus]
MRKISFSSDIQVSFPFFTAFITPSEFFLAYFPLVLILLLFLHIYFYIDD